MASYGLPAQAKAKSPLQWLLMGFPRQKPIHGFLWASKLAVCPKTLQTPKTPKRPLQSLLMGFAANRHPKRPHPWLLGFQRRQKLPQGVQACRLPALKPSKPLKPLKGHFNGFLWASSAGKSPHPWLFMGVQACRLPALKPSKPLKPLKGHFNGFLWASSAGKSPHPWLFMGVQACRLPALKRSKHA